VGRPECFLCDPDGSLVYAQSPSFFAMLGWGAVVEGYSLIATKRHIPSMFDIPDELALELNEFTGAIRTQLARLYGPSVITEHGRIGLCELLSSHEPHCFHAHRLVFPVEVDLMGALVAAKFKPRTHKNFNEARMASGDLNEYLYYERPDGVCVVTNAHGCLQRQFFRRAVASSLGQPELGSWRLHPRLDVVERVRKTLCALPKQ
jgi:diadenosine tetraphosphate (Ap4A) HIT family hydrolase